ncbi:hypothetical protein ACFL1G_00905 [Planctomycetota bacterium]
MRKFRVTFEIEGTQLAESFFLNKKNLEEMILMAFDGKGGSPLFDGNLDTTVRKIDIEKTEEIE